MKSFIRNMWQYAFALCFAFAPVNVVMAGDLQEVQSKHEFSYALTGQYPPFSFIGEDGKVQGFDVDIGQEIAKRLGVQGVPVQTAWDGIIGGLLAKKYDAIVGSLAITDSRKQAVLFSMPYYRSGAQLFVRKGTAFKTIEDLNGHTVGVGLGETYEKWMRENKPNVVLKTYKGLPLMMYEIQNGRLDGFVADKIAGLMTIKKQNINAIPVGEMLYTEQMGIAVHPGDQALIDAINNALKAMQEDGTYHTISMKWFGADIR